MLNLTIKLESFYSLRTVASSLIPSLVISGLGAGLDTAESVTLGSSDLSLGLLPNDPPKIFKILNLVYFTKSFCLLGYLVFKADFSFVDLTKPHVT